MKLNKINSLTELFFYQYEKQNNDNEMRANGGTGRRVGLKIQ